MNRKSSLAASVASSVRRGGRRSGRDWKSKITSGDGSLGAGVAVGATSGAVVTTGAVVTAGSWVAAIIGATANAIATTDTASGIISRVGQRRGKGVLTFHRSRPCIGNTIRQVLRVDHIFGLHDWCSGGFGWGSGRPTSWHEPELQHHPELVGDAPVLDDLAVFEADDIDDVDLH